MSQRTNTPSLPVFLFLVSCGALAGCETVVEAKAPARSTATPAAAKPAAQEKAVDEEEKAYKIAQAEQKLEIARLEAEVSEMSTTAALDKARQDLVVAKRGLEEQQRELEHFDKVTMPTELEQAQIGHDRATHRADESLDELRELESMYEQEEFAELTKELVLKRGRRQLELSKRSLEVSDMRLKGLKNEGLPKRRRALEHMLRDAELKVAQSEAALRKVELSNKVASMKARQKIVDAERALSKAREGKGNGK